MSEIKIGDIVEYVDAKGKKERLGSIGLVVGIGPWRTPPTTDEDVVQVNWILDMAPHLNYRHAHEHFDNQVFAKRFKVIGHREDEHEPTERE